MAIFVFNDFCFRFFHQVSMGAEAEAQMSVAAALERAISLYQRLSEALSRIVARLERRARRGGMESEDLAALRLHQNALMTVLSFELQLHKRAGVGPSASGATLDLDAARAEVDRRLRRIAGSEGA